MWDMVQLPGSETRVDANDVWGYEINAIPPCGIEPSCMKVSLMVHRGTDLRVSIVGIRSDLDGPEARAAVS